LRERDTVIKRERRRDIERQEEEDINPTPHMGERQGDKDIEMLRSRERQTLRKTEGEKRGAQTNIGSPRMRERNIDGDTKRNTKKERERR
jgi:hypothetical protein